MRNQKRYIRLFLEGLKLNRKRIKLYSHSFFIEIVANSLFVISIIFFWNAIYTNFPNHQLGLTKSELYVYLAFVEIFYGFKSAFAPVTAKLWRLVYSGRILAFMTRPIHPLILYVVSTMQLQMLVPPLPIITYLLYKSKHVWTIDSLVFGIIMALIAVVLVALLELTTSCFAFWGTKMNALDEIVDSLLGFTKYPLTVLHIGWQFIFTVIFPFMFYATIPSFIAMETKDVPIEIWFGLLCVFSLWSFFLSLLWKKGVKVYDGFNG